MTQPNTVTVHILDKEYCIACPPDERSNLESAARYLDGKMREIRSGGKVIGADRIAANGDVANKIGTYGLAVLCKEHSIPFYVAAPSSTVASATSQSVSPVAGSSTGSVAPATPF